MTTLVHKSAAYLSGETHVEINGRFATPAVQPLIVALHGRIVGGGAGCAQFIYDVNGGAVQASAPPHLHYLVHTGFSGMAIDAGGPFTWGNDASVAAVAAAVAYARANGLCHPTKKVALLAYSMGNVVAMNYIRQHGADVGAYIAEAPPYDIDYFHANGYAAEIDAAYPSGYGPSNPINFAGTIATRTRIYHAQDDTVVPIAQGQSLLAALGAADKSMITLPNGNHTAFWPNIDKQELLNWISKSVW